MGSAKNDNLLELLVMTRTVKALDKAVEKSGDYKGILKKQDEVSKNYSFPKSYVSYRKPRVVSIEQREQARKSMIERNKAKKFKEYFIELSVHLW